MRRTLALLAAALFLAGCASPSSTSEEPGAGRETLDPATGPDEGASRPYEFHTRILDDAYAHPRLDAATQATITWDNVGVRTHSVVSDDGQFAGSGPIAPGSAFAYTFLDAGDYAFHCRYHPDMKGLIVVR